MSKQINYLKKVLDSNSKNNFLRLYFNLWEDNEDISTDYCFGFANPEVSKMLIATLSKVGGNKLLFYPDFGLLSDDFDIFSLGKSIEEFMRFQKETFLSSDLTTKFYIFDESSSWFIHVDESLLFSAEENLFFSLVEKMGGEDMVLESMKSDLGACSGEARQWRDSIIKDFLSIKK